MSGTGCILTPEERGALLAVMRGRGAGAPGDGRSVGLVCRILHPGPDTVRGWPPGFGGTGLAPVDPAAYPEREGKPARGANGVRDIIQRLHGVEYTRGGAIKLMHRPGFGYVRPKPLPRQADRAAREALMRKCGRTVRDAPPDGATVLPDAAHPEWRSRPAHGREMYGWQRLVDSFLPKPGEFRVIATRCDRTAASSQPGFTPSPAWWPRHECQQALVKVPAIKQLICLLTRMARARAVSRVAMPP